MNHLVKNEEIEEYLGLVSGYGYRCADSSCYGNCVDSCDGDCYMSYSSDCTSISH